MKNANDYLQVAKSLVLLCYWGTKSFTWNRTLGSASLILGAMILVCCFNPDNPIRLICVFAGVLAVIFGNRLLLKK